MNPPRFSVSGLLGFVGLFAVGLTCLLHASSPLASVALSASLCALVLSPIGVVYRRRERRAFWLGVALGGWCYAVLCFGPWLSESLRPLLVTTKVLRWAHPIVIPETRQVSKPRPRRTFRIDSPIHGGDVEAETVHEGRVDVLVQEEREDRASPLVEDVEVVGSGGSGAAVSQVSVTADSAQFAKLTQARAGNARFVIRRRAADAVGPFSGLWSSPPVRADDFERVGHVFCGVACALAAGWAARYFYFTRDLPPPRASGGLKPR